MIAYPTISDISNKTHPIIAFDKLDGSNVRAEWTPKKGWTKFGRRNGLLDDSNPLLAQKAPPLMLEWGDDLARVFKKQRWQKVTAFFEFHGASSFAGNHVADETHTCTLIDVHVFQKGLLEPREFLKLFGHLAIPNVVYEGRAGDAFKQDIYEGSVPGVTFEGVVCKGAPVRNKPVMFKLKSREWYERLRAHCAGNDALFEKLK